MRKIKLISIYSLMLAVFLSLVLGITAQLNNGSAAAGNTAAIESNLFSVSKAASSVSYGTYNAEDHDPKNLGTKGSVTGALVKLASGDTLRYNKVIDLTGKTSDDIIMRLVITPSVIGNVDFEMVDIILTDAYNPENYVRMNVRNTGEEFGTAYAKAMANCGQVLSGWEYYPGGFFSGNNHPYGFPIRLVFDGNVSKRSELKTIADNNIAFSIDYAEKQVHHKERTNTQFTVICDLDDQKDFYNPWNGFTTGECFLSVVCSSYISPTADFVITEIMGEPVQSIGAFERSAPKVVIDFENYAENDIPCGVTGIAYRLFGAKGVSPYYSNISVTRKVFFDYNGPGKSEYTVNNGYFTPDKAGTYTVEYIATDESGKKGTAVYNVLVLDSITDISIDYVGERQESGIAGNLIKLAEVSAEGGSGKLEIVKTVKFGLQDVEVDNNCFRPLQSGIYEVSIKAKDFLGTEKELCYTVTIESGNKPVFLDNPILPLFFISGREYPVQPFYAYDYTDGSGRTVNTVISYKDSQGIKLARGGIIAPVAENNGDLTEVTYTATINGNSEVLTVSVPTVILRGNNNAIIAKNLFYTDGSGNVNATEECIELQFTEDSTFSFVNPLISNSLSIRFSGNEGMANYDRIVFTITDSKNQNQKIRLTYVNNGTAAAFCLNDNMSIMYSTQKLLSKKTDVISFLLDDMKHKVRYERTIPNDITIATYLNGERYEGFSSGLVYVSVSLYGVASSSSLNIWGICGKVMTNDESDYIGPKFAFLGEYGGSHEIGSEFVIPMVIASDVIDGKTDVMLTVKDSAGNVMVTTDGIKLENVLANQKYSMIFNSYGTYVVTLISVDSDGNKNTFSYNTIVIDNIKPTIKLSGQVPTSGKAGEKIVLPTATANDNNDSEVTVRMYLLTDTGSFFNLTTPAFIPGRAGRYTVRYCCMDVSGNLTIQDYAVIVE